jgi:hypothetical protein
LEVPRTGDWETRGHGSQSPEDIGTIHLRRTRVTRSSHFGDSDIEGVNGGVFRLRDLRSPEEIRVVHLWRTRGVIKGTWRTRDHDHLMDSVIVSWKAEAFALQNPSCEIVMRSEPLIKEEGEP